MAQWVKTPAAQPKDLSLIPGPHVMEGTELTFAKLSSDLHMNHGTCPPLSTHT